MDGAPFDIEYAERGDGPALLLLPGSFSSGAGWKAVTERLSRGYRIVTTSLLGYGATAEHRRRDNATMRQQVKMIDRLLERIAAPTHVVGHSFGGFSALAHAMEGKVKPVSLTLVEANPFGLLKTAGELELYGTIVSMLREYFAAFDAGDPDAARHVIDFYGGAGAYLALPIKVRDYVMRTTPANVRDWSSGMPFEPPVSAWRSLAVPTMVIRGEEGHPAMRRVAELLAEYLPASRLESIAGGGHFLPATHPAEVASLIDASVGAALS